MLPDHNGYSEDYLENTELNRGIFLSLSSADQKCYKFNKYKHFLLFRSKTIGN